MGVWRKVFGPSKDELWRLFAYERGAAFLQGRFLQPSRVIARFRQWTITLDTHIVPPNRGSPICTCIQAPYLAREPFSLTIYRQGLFGGLGTLLGAQDITVGCPELDNHFVVQGSDEYRVRRLLGSSSVRELIWSQKSMHLTIEGKKHWSPSFPEGASQLCFCEPGVIVDVDRLLCLFDLFEATLDQLYRTGLAYGHSAGFALDSAQPGSALV